MKPKVNDVFSHFLNQEDGESKRVCGLSASTDLVFGKRASYLFYQDMLIAHLKEGVLKMYPLGDFPPSGKKTPRLTLSRLNALLKAAKVGKRLKKIEEVFFLINSDGTKERFQCSPGYFYSIAI